MTYIIPGKIPPTDGGPSVGRFTMVPNPRVPGTATTTAHIWELKLGSQVPDSGGSVVQNQQTGRSAQDLNLGNPDSPWLWEPAMSPSLLSLRSPRGKMGEQCLLLTAQQ